jgi:peroxiredoxin
MTPDSFHQMTTQIQVGDKIPFDEITTIGDKTVKLSGGIGYIHLHFARYTGCPICNFHFKKYQARLEDIKSSGVQPFFILHSPKQQILENQMESSWARKLDFVSDVSKDLYFKVGCEADLSFRQMFFWQVIKDALLMRQFMKRFMSQGKETGIKQRPMDILIDAKTGIVVASKYGKTISDRWSVDDLLNWVKYAKEAAETQQAEGDSYYLTHSPNSGFSLGSDELESPIANDD